MENEREKDVDAFDSPALFLPANTTKNNNKTGRLSSWAIHSIWKDVCMFAQVEGKTPHSARHAMGRHIIEKTGNVSAVQRQLGHKNPAYSMQYSRVTSEELKIVLNNRE